jgi:tRNA (guanine-N7-)-methyltransferase
MATKNKLAKFADMATYPNCLQYTFEQLQETGFPLKGRWHEDYFHNQNPIVLELGCGKGEYTVGLARRYPNKNFIGIDIKGARMWTGATAALKENLTNVAFVRTHIELIEQFFAADEVSEIWITFCDPQMKKVTKRLTCTLFMKRYTHIMKPGGLVHLKCDSNFLFTYTEEMTKANKLEVLASTRDLYAPDAESNSDNNIDWEALRTIQTAYEKQWIARGKDIKYMLIRLYPHDEWIEPDVEIPLDDYRSYNRDKRSSLEQHV